MVQCANPPPIQALVVIRLLTALAAPVGGAVASLQISPLIGRLILRLGPEDLHRFYICIGFELIPDIRKQIASQLLENQVGNSSHHTY